MPKLKSESGSDQSVDVDDIQSVRRRVVKACQRCRLKKCKCDGSTPCTRCKSDDAICAYGKHKKSDKIIFRKGYVQMLERQHTQLIAGLQELYRRTQTAQGWTGAPLDLTNYGQPLTHKILESLGVLRSEEWDDTDGPDGTSSWQSFEQQSQEGSGIFQHDNNGSETSSPNTTAAMSPLSISIPPPAFPNSTIMTKRRSKYEAAMQPISQTLAQQAPLPLFHPYSTNNDYKALPLTNDSGFVSDNGGFGGDMHLGIPPPFCERGTENELQYSGGGMEWSLGADDLFDITGNQGALPLQAMG